MKKYIMGIVAILVVLMLLGAMFLVTGDNTWDTDWDSETEEPGDITGLWEEEIIVGYADGSNQSLKILQDNVNNPFGLVKYNGEIITYVQYKVYATASGGSAYDKCRIDEFSQHVAWLKKSGSGWSTIKDFYNTKDSTDIPIGKKTTIIADQQNVDNNFGDRPDGTYRVEWYTSGKVKYKGIPGGFWQSTDLPPGRYIDFTVSGNQLQLVLTSGTGTKK